MAATAASPPLPPRPPGARKALREKGEGSGGERSPRCGSSQWLPSLLPRSRRRPAGALRVRTLSAPARFGRPPGMRTPALTLRAGGWRLAAGAGLGGGGWGRAPGLGRRRRAVAERRVRLCVPRGASASEFARPPLPPWELIVLRQPRVLVSSPLGRGHPREPDGHPGPWGSSSPCPRSQAMDTHLGCKSEPLAWTVILAVASPAGGASARPGPGEHKGPGRPPGLGMLRPAHRAAALARGPGRGDPRLDPRPGVCPCRTALHRFTYKERMHSSATVNISSKLCSAEIEILQMTLLRQWATWETSSIAGSWKEMTRSKLHEGRGFVVLSAGPQLLRRLLTQKRPGHICTRYF
ncbi:translation initiation factor IF-2-like isoform X1 [Canis lupus familiaris]|uniref:translation initiation factor IF-2-like isoform X1 n=1 Tax=Canis lupus familiaris TaxID=9615 RepID=UPI0018F40D3D|nr:translation initiation factor IF-2-like isoform X1 [Canis lupus familiaris]